MVNTTSSTLLLNGSLSPHFVSKELEADLLFTTPWSNIPHDAPIYYSILLYNNLIMCPLIAVGNFLVICVIARYMKMRTTTNLTIANMAAADLLNATIAIPLYSILHFTHFRLEPNKYFCLLSTVFVMTCIFMTVCTVNVIAFDRYLSILHPYFYETERAKSIIKGSLIGSWLLSFVFLFVMPLLGWNTWREHKQCRLQFVMPVAYSITFAVGLLLLMATATYQYIRIALVARKHHLAIQDQTMNQPHKHLKVTKMLLLILGLFYICVVPYLILSLVKISYPHTQPEWVNILTKVLVSLSLINSFLNPVIYVTHNRMFRYAFMKLLCNVCHLGRMPAEITIPDDR